jgi:hypothetical protein
MVDCDKGGFLEGLASVLRSDTHSASCCEIITHEREPLAHYLSNPRALINS